MKKPVFYTELTYLLGIVVLALGATLLVCADFGVSVVVAPAYLIHLKLSETWSFVTFGVAEYIVQAILLMALILTVRRFHWSYLFAFVTALFYGVILDAFMLLFSALSPDFWLRLVLFAIGMLLCALGVSFVLHTYISPEVYELFIKEVAAKFGKTTGNMKIAYDAASFLLALLFSFAFFGFWPLHGIGIGTVIAIVNGRIIGVINRFLERHFDLRPRFAQFERFFAPPPFQTKLENEA